MGLSIITLTVAIRLATWPLTVRQVRMTQAQSAMAPRLEEVNRRFKGDPQRRSQETMRLYKEHGISPLGCLGPMVIQLPIWIGLYSAIIQGIGNTPGTVIYLSQHLYSWLPGVLDALPLEANFLWLDLTLPDPTPVLPVLVGGSMWVVQKMTMAPAATSQQQSTNAIMLWMMPIMFGFFAFTFPSGLSLYWVVSNAMTVVMQYFIIGWGGLRPAAAPAASGLQAAGEESARDDQQEPGSVGTDGGRGDSDRPRRTRRRPRRSRSRRPGPG
jgi:YidC/Oxa1 family membrane protein insertase